ncbi:MAG: hypothetical protein U0230_20625 [Polyangiales bacterium]
MTLWTFGIDESGTPEGALVDRDQGGRGGFLVGGPLAPVADHVLADAMASEFRRAEMVHGLPPGKRHANELSDAQRIAVLRELSTRLAGLGGVWLFFHDERTASGLDELEALLRYLRTLSASVEGAGRLGSMLGASRLALRIAQRSIPLEERLVAKVRRGGAALHQTTSEHGIRYRAVVESEARQALESLGREAPGWLAAPCALDEVLVEVAADPSSSGAIHAADFACNAVFRALRDARSGEGPAKADALAKAIPGGAPILVLRADTLHRIRRLDRALRADPPDLVAAAEAIELPAAANALEAEILGAIRTILERAWVQGLTRLSESRSASEAAGGRVESLARALAFRAGASLAARSGHFESTWRALHAGWAGDEGLPARVRERTTDRALRARLARLVVECANHRGDVDSALAWADRHRDALGGRRSVRALADSLEVEILATVAVQNELPTAAERVEVTRTRLEERTKRLESLADETRSLFDLANARERGLDREPPLWGDGDRALYGALDREPPEPRPDPESGMAYGTIARSWAFLGRLDEALDAALEARRYFLDSEPDLRFNAHVIGRILAERARLGARSRSDEPEALRLALQLAGASVNGVELLDAKSVRQQPALRFGIDLALRALLHATELEPRASRWAQALASRDGQQLRSSLASDLRSHPSELVARHAAELVERHLGRKAALPWYDFAVALADEAVPGSTLARIGMFTRRLRDEPGFAAEGPVGSVFAPTFEYR